MLDQVVARAFDNPQKHLWCCAYSGGLRTMRIAADKKTIAASLEVPRVRSGPAPIVFPPQIDSW